MRRKHILSLGFILEIVMFCVPAFAHHGGSEYDEDHPVMLKGSVTKFEWNNPHCQIFVNVKDDKGKVVRWSIETFAPAVMKRVGWTRETLHAGDEVTITLLPSKRGNPAGRVRKVVFPDGKEFSGGVLREPPPQ